MPFRQGSGDTAFPDAQTFDKQYTAAKKFTEAYVKGIVAAADPTAKLTAAIAALTKSISGGSGLEGVTEKIKATSGQFTQLSSVGIAAMTSLVGALKSFAQAGLEGTGQAAMLSFQTQQLARGVAAVFLPAIETAIDVVRRLSDFFHGLSESQQNAIQGLVVGVTVFKAVAALTALGIEAGIATGGLSLIAGALAAVATGAGGGGSLGKLGDVFTSLLDGSLGKLGDVFTSLLDAVKPVLDVFSDLFGTMFAVIAPAITAVVGVVQSFGAIFGSVFGQLVEAATPFLELIGERFTGYIKAAGSILQGLAPAFGLVADYIGILLSVMEPLGEAFGDFGSIAIAAVGSLLEALKPVFDELKTAFAEVGVAVSEVMELIKPLLVDMTGALSDFLTGALVPIAKFLIEGFVHAFKAMIEYIMQGVAAVKSAAKLLKGELNIRDFMDDQKAEFEAMLEKARDKQAGAGKKTEAGKPGRQITPTAGSFEGVEEMFKRIQTAAADTGKADAEKTADNTEKAAGFLKDLKDFFFNGGLKDPPKPLPMS